MSRLGFLAIAILVVIPSIATAQDRSPELERLGYFVGTWAMDAGDMGTGEMACEWLGAMDSVSGACLLVGFSARTSRTACQSLGTW
jgi:hypothetical protein